MGDIVDNEETDRDTLPKEDIEKQFNITYSLLTENATHLQKTYINTLTATNTHRQALGVDNKIEIYELSNTSLKRLCGLSGHSKGLTEVVFNPNEDHLLYSSGHDGLVKLWDTRASGTCVIEFKNEDSVLRPFECIDISCNGRILCAGSQLVQHDAYLVFWDIRQPDPLGGYWDSHQDDITQVKFHKEKSEILATGSLDGLVNIFNVVEQTEDDALIYSLNIENAIEKISWLDDNRVACITTSNDLQIWNSETGDMNASFGRDKVSRSIKRSKGDDCYLVDTFTTTDNTTVLLAGSNAGNGDVLRSLAVNEKKLQPLTNFKENKQIVRCCWYDKHSDLLVTAGESGIVSVWKSGDAATTSSGSNVAKSEIKLQGKRRHKPY